MKLILVLLLLIPSSNLFATSKDKYGHLYIGLGELLNPSTIKFGNSKWEAGKLNRSNLGFVFVSHDQPLYVNYGFSVNINGMPGLFGALGYEKTFWKFLFMRSEVNIGHGIDNFSQSEINIGLGVYW